MPRKKAEPAIETPELSMLQPKEPTEPTVASAPESATDTAAASEPPKRRRTVRKKAAPAKEPEPPENTSAEYAPILTIETRAEVERPEEEEEIRWHEIQNAYRVKRILTGVLDGQVPMESGNIKAVVNYMGYQVAIPLSEMMIELPSDSGRYYGDTKTRQSKLLSNMLGAQIDFVIRGIDSKTRSIVASRKDAMLRKRRLFYEPTDGVPRIYPGRIVQARVIATGEKVVRVEIFGVETAIFARDLTRDWIGDARDKYHVGDQILVRVQEVVGAEETLSVRADVRSLQEDAERDDLSKCQVQGKYAAVVTDIHRGVYFLRLRVGVNAVAHSCYDTRRPGKKDEVIFVVTRLDPEHNVAVGIISRIIRQNL